MRRIDADALKDLIYESWGGDPAYHTARYGQLKTETEAKAEYACLMLENIDAQPTIEAEPRKHGRWKVLHGVLAGDDIYGDMGECSNCGLHLRNYEWDYCPNCGAKMDEEDDQ